MFFPKIKFLLFLHLTTVMAVCAVVICAVEIRTSSEITNPTIRSVDSRTVGSIMAFGHFHFIHKILSI